MRIRWLTIFLDFPAPVFGPEVAFWQEVTGSGLSPRRGAAGEFATLLPASGDACLRVQRAGDGDGGCHLDLHADPAAGTPGEAAERAAALGARVRHRDGDLVILDSPGGLTFCLVPWEGEAVVPRPAPLGPGDVSGADHGGPSHADHGARPTDHGGAGGADHGGLSRADQLCLDIPPGAYDRECSFWAALTGWELRAGRLPEFAHLGQPASIPLRLLLQRRQTAAGHDRVTGHIDFACEDNRRLARRHEAAGARVLATFPRWVVMADPAGRRYCLTMREPWPR